MHEQFLRDALSNRYNRAILDRWHDLDLSDGWLVAGCLFQTVWNLRSGLPPDALIKDYDLFYFDDSDLSAQAEQSVQARVEQLLSDLPITVEAKNQARVHQWYEQHFGYPYPALRSASEGIDRFLVLASCVGLRRNGACAEIHAPHGLALLYGGQLSPNPLTNHSALFEQKAQSYTSRWPRLHTVRSLPDAHATPKAPISVRGPCSWWASSSSSRLR